MKSFLVFSFLAYVPVAFGADYKYGNCSDTDFLQGAWQDLVGMEPRIGQELVEIGKASGEYGAYIPVTNCRISWPVDEKGEPLDGLRTAIIDKVWYSPTGDKDKPLRLSQGGIKIIYHMKSEYVCGSSYCGGPITPHWRTVRAVRGIVLCRTPEVCRALSIPFADAPPSDGRNQERDL